MKVEVSSLTTNIDLFTPVNTQMSNSKMSTQVHDENFKPKLMKDQCFCASHWLLNYKKWSTKINIHIPTMLSHITKFKHLYISKAMSKKIESSIFSSKQDIVLR